jgi:bacteriorhodopsin
MGNHAIATNPPTSPQALTAHGSDWLWFITAISFVASVLFGFMASRLDHSRRIFYHLAVAICFINGVAYFTMASDLGKTPIFVEFSHGAAQIGSTRDIFYAKYINW